MFRVLILFVTLNISGCVLYDYYQQDCAISTDYFNSLPVAEQEHLKKKCGGPPQMKQVLPN